MSASDPPLHERMRNYTAMMVQGTPHARALGMEVFDIQKGKAWGRVNYREDLVGDPESGVLAGGVITALLDNLCGVAVVAAMDEPSSTATLDLRIDYMRAATPGLPVLAMAHCYKTTRSVSFVRAVAYETDPDDPIANASGAFMLAANSLKGFGSNRKPPK